MLELFGYEKADLSLELDEALVSGQKPRFSPCYEQ